MLRMLGHEGAAELERVGASGPGHFFHEAFHVDGVLVGVDATPWADRHVRVTHRVFDQEIRHGVAELRVAGLVRVSLELAGVLAVGNQRRVHERVDRLAGDAQV